MEPVPEPLPPPAAVVDEESPAPERKKPAIGRQRRSAFDVISGDGDTGRKRRSAADILAAPLGGDATGPGRLRRTTDGETVTTDVRPGGLRRQAFPDDGDAVVADVRPGGLRREGPDDGDTDVRPGGLRRPSTPPDGPPAADEG